MNIPAYLERIAYRGPLDASAPTLRQLHVAHLLAVPFENLSIHAREPVILDDEALFEKIVIRRRGGFCYELNGLFAALLRTLGFEVAMLSAGVRHSEGGFGPEFDHMALLVTLEERWLVDVGFGDAFREPLRLDERGEQVQGERTHRIEECEGYLVLTERGEAGEWRARYRFTLEPHGYADYAERCRYQETSPISTFTQRRICQLATLEGRVTLGDVRMITTTNGERHERELDGTAEYAAALREQFGIVMPNLSLPGS
jgi:N-hydroxyarylamine O-acetyltransferase